MTTLYKSWEMEEPRKNSTWRNAFTGERVRIVTVINDMVYYNKEQSIIITFNKPIKTFLNTYSKCQTN